MNIFPSGFHTWHFFIELHHHQKKNKFSLAKQQAVVLDISAPLPLIDAHEWAMT